MYHINKSILKLIFIFVLLYVLIVTFDNYVAMVSVNHCYSTVDIETAD